MDNQESRMSALAATAALAVAITPGGPKVKHSPEPPSEPCTCGNKRFRFSTTKKQHYCTNCGRFR